MKKQYISPVAEIFECKTNAMLMNSVFDPNIDSESIIPTDDVNPGEFSGHEFDFQIEEDDDKSFFEI